MWDLQRLWLEEEQRWWWWYLSESRGDGQPLACCLGKMQHASGDKIKLIFPDSFTHSRRWQGRCFTVSFQCRTQLLSTCGRHWLRSDTRGRIFQFGCSVHVALEDLQMDTYSSGVTSHGALLVYCDCGTSWKFVVLKLKLSLPQDFEFISCNFNICSSSCALTCCSSLHTALGSIWWTKAVC